MPRRRTVNRTVTSNVYTVIVADIAGERTFADDYDLGPKTRTVAGVLKAVDGRLGEGYKALKVTATRKETARYTMDEARFMELAEKVPVKGSEG